MRRLVIALAFLVAGCGAIPGLGADGEQHDQLVKYAQCLRGQGVNATDPPPGENSFNLDARGLPRDKVEAALKTCKQYAPKQEPPSAEDLDRMRKTAACLRRNGIEASDPTAAEPGIKVGRPKDGKNVDAIMAACRKEVGE
ncbi:hypothetical protein [Sphaerisporangium dianthi]|uniref:Lipoprotein n=1 Tax=Sphaerisporangium dianthi TaxID=1436120 RepID=A0ABV9CKV6_9ACTN